MIRHAHDGQLTLVFVRHGDAFEVAGRCIGHTDVPLSDEGIAGVRRLVADQMHDANEGAHDTRAVSLISSDLQRAVQTAAIIAESMNVSFTTDPALREMNFGQWDGRWWSDLESSDSTRLRDWMENWTTAAPPGGESIPELEVRVASWLHEHANVQDRATRTLIVISHAGFIRAALCRLLGIPVSQMFDIPVGHARATTVRLEAGAAPVLMAADAPNLF